MSRIAELERKIVSLYRAKDPHRADWADWLFQNHIFIVAKNAGVLAERFNANKELAMAAAMLHDIADSVMHREDECHEEKSREIARRLLRECDFSNEEIPIIVDDAIRFHGCHGTHIPNTLEGKVMATADAMAHLQTDFYDFALKMMRERPKDTIIKWALPKIERDYRKKIFFEDVRNEVTEDYERVKKIFTL